MLHNLCFIFCRLLLFRNFIYFSSGNTFFISHVLKIKYQPDHLKVKDKNKNM